MPLQPGEISLHHVLAAHASEPNRSDDRRIGIAIRYVPPYVRQINGDRDSALLVRGEDRYGNFIHEKPPVADMDAAALAEHKRIMEFRQSALYQGVRGKAAPNAVGKRRRRVDRQSLYQSRPRARPGTRRGGKGYV